MPLNGGTGLKGDREGFKGVKMVRFGRKSKCKETVEV